MVIADGTRLINPNVGAMREHLEHLFGGTYAQAHYGEIELAWTDPVPDDDGRYALRHAKRFKTDALEEMAEEAARLNLTPMCNVYVGAALRRPHFPGDGPVGRASDVDFLALTCAYADLDEPGTTAAAKDKYGTVKPTKIAVTGRVPAPRAQLWWRLDEPIDSPVESRALLEGIAAALGGDTTVTNPSRVMRLAGSIAWPMKPERVVEMTHFGFLKQPGQPEYAPAHMQRVFHLEEQRRFYANGNGALNGTVIPLITGPEYSKDAFGQRINGRENNMRDMVWRIVCRLYRTSPTGPPPPELSMRMARHEYQIYEIKTGLQKPHPEGLTKGEKLDLEGRGWEAFWEKWQYAMAQWHMKVRERAWINPPEEEQAESVVDWEQQIKAPGNVLEYLDVRQIKAQPDPVWLIDGLINEECLGFIYGPPGSLKTFIALDVALTITTRLASWWGRKVNRHGAVIYLCREGIASLKFRLIAWEKHRQTVADDAPFYLIRKNLNFMRPEDVSDVIATIAEIAAKINQPIAAVFVDTVSRVLPGAKENQQEDMTLFIAACDAIRQQFNCVAVGVHHTNREGLIRGSSVIPGGGDFLVETKREPGAMTGSIVLQKVKDGEDGQEFQFKVTKLEWTDGLMPRSSLIADPTDEAPPASSGSKDGLPDRAICREILAAIAQAWFNGAPMSVDNSARPAVQMIMARWFLKRDAVKKLIVAWMANGIIEHTEMPGKKKVKGYRKLTDL